MAKLKVPSAQHLARNWQATPQAVQKGLVHLVQHPPTFSYAALYNYVRDLLVFGVSYEQIVAAIKRSIRRPDVQANFLELLPLIVDHFRDIGPTYVQGIERRYYPAGRGLMIPFDPPVIYGVGGEVHFPWLSFWKNNPLAGEKLSLFITIVDEVLLQDPDLENAKFHILDFSAPRGSKTRELIVLEAAEIPRLTPERKDEMLAIFAEGYFLAADELATTPAPDVEEQAEVDPDQPGLFDDQI